MITVIVTIKATRTDVVTTDVLSHVDIQVVSGPVGTVVLTKVIVVVKVTAGMMASGVHLPVTDHDHPIMALSQEGTGMEDQHPHTLTSHAGLGSLHPHLVTSDTTAISRRGLMIVDINHNHLPDHPSTELHVDRYRTTVTSMVRLSTLVINVDHHLGVDIRCHVGGRIARRHEDALVHEEDNTISMAVAILMNDVVVHVIGMMIDHHIKGTPLEALTFQNEVDTKDPNPMGKQTENAAAHIREKGIARIRRGDGTYDYKFERNRASNSGAEADINEDGSSGVLVITREEIIENINKNPKMTRTEKRLTRVEKRYFLRLALMDPDPAIGL
ncbi:unnamed protein product [Phytophthora fragariaefolia]|uniref:Unnamed protein product n=1 Tax=Phytophthora fragariaefolia TaxID=1490495 RepID=A0A9W6XNZ2_9STRA|nr:unnamed protein product [Phytophthora fragariaefolia]